MSSITHPQQNAALEQRIKELYDDKPITDNQAAAAARRLVGFFQTLERIDKRLKKESVIKH